MSAAQQRLIRVISLGQTGYQDALLKMRSFTKARDQDSPDEIWLTYHPPVFTLGQAGKAEHLFDPGDIPVVRTDRGGQVTYHCPGQVVAYVMVDLRRAGFGVRTLVRRIEQALLDTLGRHNIAARLVGGRPGVYVGMAKVGAIGLRVSRGCSYHGCSLNVDCDLAPFAGMDTCGYADLTDTSMRELGCQRSPSSVARDLGAALGASLLGPNPQVLAESL